MDKAIEKLEYMSKKYEERHIVDSLKDYERDYYNDTKTAKEEGLKEGQKKEKSIEIAKNMLNLNIDINIISQSTGLSVDEIKNLSK